MDDEAELHTAKYLFSWLWLGLPVYEGYEDVPTTRAVVSESKGLCVNYTHDEIHGRSQHSVEEHAQFKYGRDLVLVQNLRDPKVGCEYPSIHERCPICLLMEVANLTSQGVDNAQSLRSHVVRSLLGIS